MKLAELSPRWIHPNVFVFRCPHCRNVWLSCKDVAMADKEQADLLRVADLEPHGPRYGSVMTVPGMAWRFEGRDFATMTVTPSIDASKARHWHGRITNGEIA